MPLSMEAESAKQSTELVNDASRTNRKTGGGELIKTRMVNPDDQNEIQLCHRSLSLGERAMTQFWLDKRTLVSRNGSSGKNFHPILDCFHGAALQNGDIKTETIETHLMTSLLPSVRQDAAQKIFPDARLKKQSAKLRGDSVAELEQLLCRCRDDRLDLFAFRNKVREALGFQTSGPRKSLSTTIGPSRSLTG